MQKEHAPNQLPDPPECFHRLGATWSEDEFQQARQYFTDHYCDSMIAISYRRIYDNFPSLRYLIKDDRLHEEAVSEFFLKFAECVARYDPCVGRYSGFKAFTNWAVTYLWGSRGGYGIGHNFIRKITRHQYRFQSLDEMNSENCSDSFHPQNEIADTTLFQSILDAKEVLEGIVEFLKEDLDKKDFEIFRTIEISVENAARQLGINVSEVIEKRALIEHKIMRHLIGRYPEYFQHPNVISWREFILFIRNIMD